MIKPLDQLWAKLGPSPKEPDLRRYYQALLAAELFLPLEEASQSGVTPYLVELEGTAHALVFSEESGLAAFFEEGADRVELTGAGLIEMLAGEGLGLALNPGLDRGQFFMPPETVTWLVEGDVEAGEKQFIFKALGDVPSDALAQILDAVGTLSGRVEHAVLAGTEEGGLVLVLVEAEGALVPEFGRLLSVVDAGVSLDLVLMTAADFTSSGLRDVGLALEVPDLPEPVVMKAPGSDPEKPPKLR